MLGPLFVHARVQSIHAFETFVIDPSAVALQYRSAARIALGIHR